MGRGTLTILGGVALGTGIEADLIEDARATHQLDAIAWDNGTIDFGPHLLGGNNLYQPRENTKADLGKLMRVSRAEDIPLIISSAIGAGARYHVDTLSSLVEQIVTEEELEGTTIARIYTDVGNTQLKNKIRGDDISILDWDKPLTDSDVDESSNIVGMVGPDSFVRTLEMGADVIVGGRALDVSPFAALPIRAGIDRATAIHFGKLMECGGLVTDIPVSSEPVVGTVSDDYFEIEPTNSEARCTVNSISKHHLYEKTDPYVIHTPSGRTHLNEVEFEQISETRVRVSEATYEEKETSSILLEGAGQAGYETIAIGGIRSPAVISQIDKVIKEVRDHVKSTTDIQYDDYDLIFKKYGIDAVPLFPVQPPSDEDPYEIGIVIRAVGKTQEIANNICESARFRLYTKREFDPSGALASPVKQSTYEAGEAYKHTIHHLMEFGAEEEVYELEMEEIQ